jgi:hypothetical protein
MVRCIWGTGWFSRFDARGAICCLRAPHSTRAETLGEDVIVRSTCRNKSDEEETECVEIGEPVLGFDRKGQFLIQERSNV